MSNVIQPEMLRETEQVVVWQSSLQPGESLAEHDHQVGYVVVVIEGDRIRVDEADGESREVDVHPGEVLIGGPRPPHSVINVGSAPYREILVELK